MGPNTAFCLVIFGVLGIYCEFIWPGRIFPGICGAAAAVTGGYYLCHVTLTAPRLELLGLELLATATTLFVVDAFVNTLCIAGTLATAALTAGFLTLVPGPRTIHPALAIPWCLALGVLTIALNWTARRARRNKSIQSANF